jgi:hypothetical protein
MDSLHNIAGPRIQGPPEFPVHATFRAMKLNPVQDMLTICPYPRLILQTLQLVRVPDE